MHDEIEQWIKEQIAQLGMSELLMVKGVLDDIAAGRPVERFEAGTVVYVDGGTTRFVVQGTVPWYENGVVSRKIRIRTGSGSLSGQVYPEQLRWVP